jgi:hypothetical protein
MMQPPPPTLNMKSCRYGKNCVRPDCKFWHEGRPQPIVSGGLPFDPRTGGGVGLSSAHKYTEFEMNPEVQVKWLPSKIRISISDGKVEVTDLDGNNQAQKSSLHSEEEEEELRTTSSSSPMIADYELISLVVFVRDVETEDRNNLVALVRVPSPYFQRVGQPHTKTGWLLFNDFS